MQHGVVGEAARLLVFRPLQLPAISIKSAGCLIGESCSTMRAQQEKWLASSFLHASAPYKTSCKGCV